MIDRDFIEAIIENAQAKVVTVDGKEYSTATLVNPPLPEEPQYPTLQLLTLDSLIDYAKEDTSEDPSLIVAGADKVLWFGEETGERRIRPVYARVNRGFDAPCFGQYQSIEDFRIWLLTRFRDTPDREIVLKFIVKVSDEHVATSEDDGISQTVTVRKGIATHSAATVPSPLQLAPIRTFIEVEQPVGHFIFRLKQEKDKLPTAALFELPTNWEREAAINVKKYLDGKTDVPVFA